MRLSASCKNASSAKDSIINRAFPIGNSVNQTAVFFHGAFRRQNQGYLGHEHWVVGSHFQYRSLCIESFEEFTRVLLVRRIFVLDTQNK